MLKPTWKSLVMSLFNRNSRMSRRRRERRVPLSHIESVESRPLMSATPLANFVNTTDGFESGAPSAYWQHVDGLPVLSVVSNVAHTGHSSVRLHYAHNEDNGQLQRFHEDFSQGVYISFWQMFPDGMKSMPNGSGLKMLRFFDDPTIPDTNKPPGSENPFREPIQFEVHQAQGGPSFDVTIINQWPIEQNFHAPLDVKPGVWFKLGVYMKYNTVGKNDGILQVWKDDQLLIDQKNVGFRTSVANGKNSYMIGGNFSSSNQTNFPAFDRFIDDVQVSNSPTINSPKAGISVTPATGLVTTENGGTAKFSVVLNSRPTANVTIDVGSTDLTEGTVNTSKIVFTPANWNLPQTYTITGVNDSVADGTVNYAISLAPTVSADPLYNGLNPDDPQLINTDNEPAEPNAGVSVTPATGLVTTENGGTAKFSVVLNSRPSANVTIAVGSTDLTEGTVNTSKIVFTPANWNLPQTFTVTGVNDSIADGNINYAISLAPTVSEDIFYRGLNPADPQLINRDNEPAEPNAGVSVTPATGLVTTENGGTAKFSVVLNSRPTANVTIDVGSTDLTEGTVNTSKIVFTPANWNLPQTYTVTGVNDSIADGNVNYAISLAPTVSEDIFYRGLNPADPQLVNQNILHPTFDFDGDGKTDEAVYLQGDGVWSVRKSSTATTVDIQWGAYDQTAVSGMDYDGDGKTDLATYRQKDGIWSILLSSRNFDRSKGAFAQLGGPDQIPVGNMDLDGDGKTDLATYQTSTGIWSLKETASGKVYGAQWGGADQIPVAGMDIDGDGKTDLAAYRPHDGFWSIRKSSDGLGQAFQWGGIGQIPVGGMDYDGDGKSDLVAYRKNDGMWSIRRSSDGIGKALLFGGTDYTPVPGFELTGDGRSDLAVRKATTGLWSVMNSATGQFSSIFFGSPNQPIPLDSDGNAAPSVPSLSITQPMFSRPAGTDVSSNGSSTTLTYGVPANGGTDRGSLTFTSANTGPITDMPFFVGSFKWHNAETESDVGHSDPSGNMTISLGLGDSKADIQFSYSLFSSPNSKTPDGSSDDRFSIGQGVYSVMGPTGKPAFFKIIGIAAEGKTPTISVDLAENGTETYQLYGQLVPDDTPPSATLDSSGVLFVNGTDVEDIIEVKYVSNGVGVEYVNSLGLKTPVLIHGTGIVGPVTYVPTASVRALSVNGKSGNDNLTVSVGIPSFLYGGAGDDVLTGGSANDSLFGGFNYDRGKGRYDQDTLTGSGGADRFLIQGNDVVIDSGSADVRIHFINGSQTWSDDQIILIDKAFDMLVNRTNNTRLLALPDKRELTFRREVSLPYDWFASNSLNGNIQISNRAFSTDQSVAPIWSTIIHEIGHNWENQFEDSTGDSFSNFSGWVEDPSFWQKFGRTQGRNPDPYTPINHNLWWYLTDSSFVSEYAKVSPGEDFAETLASVFLSNSRYHPQNAIGKVNAINSWLDSLK